MKSKRQWLIWFLMTIGLVGYLAFSLVSQPGVSARTFLPGKTTHGHYQIELQCNECHSAGMGVLQDACTRCHGDDLKRSNDTHPRSKFTDPGKMHLVRELDGRACITCHEEHVPDRTLAMGLSLPDDYCWHCHQEVGEQRPSHKDLAYDSCATAGCHNYHDNRALFENFLVKHHGEGDMLEQQVTPPRDFAAVWAADHPDDKRGLNADDHDAPPSVDPSDALIDEWATTAHANAGVNCTACHAGDDGGWYDKPTHDSCAGCHGPEVEAFTRGRHGMRLAVGLSPMTPAQARLPMKHPRLHAELTCVACHGDHRFDTRFAAAEACLTCHNDDHTKAYVESSHYDLWLQELAGEAEPGTGVSCATCHMPREEDDSGRIVVQHNQNSNLRPNEKMARSVCMNCHGLQFTLDALADPDLVRSNFQGEPEGRVESLDMAKAWVDERERLRQERLKKRGAKQARQTRGGDATNRR